MALKHLTNLCTTHRLDAGMSESARWGSACLQMYSKQILYVMHSTYLQFLTRNLSILSISRSMAENNFNKTAYLYTCT